MAARLKVFVTSDGLNDYVVAAASRPKALAAWGVRQDLFKEGLAHQTDDAALSQAALAKPGEVLRRSAGAAGKLAAMPRPAPARPAGPDKARRAARVRLEARLEALERRQRQAAERFAAGHAALDARQAQADARAKAERLRLESALRDLRS